MRTVIVVAAFALGSLETPAMATEEPRFTVKLVQAPFEVRDYPAMVVAEVAVTGGQKEAASKGFRLLAGYIFGGNARTQKLAMTAPVVQSPASGEKIAMTAPVLQTGGNGKWVIRFIMPSGSTLATLPRPTDPKVQLRTIGAARLAVVRFSGLARQDDVAARTLTLMQFVKANHLQPLGIPSLAQYDPPWTPWFMRRNEVLMPVEPGSAPER